MTFESGLLEAVRARLLADAAFAALAGERVYAFATPEAAAFPCAVLSVPEGAIPDDTYLPTRESVFDVMSVGREWEPVDQMTGRVRALLDLQDVTISGAQALDFRMASSAFYSEREGRDTLFYGTARFTVRYTE